MYPQNKNFIREIAKDRYKMFQNNLRRMYPQNGVGEIIDLTDPKLDSVSK